MLPLARAQQDGILQTADSGVSGCGVGLALGVGRHDFRVSGPSFFCSSAADGVGWWKVNVRSVYAIVPFFLSTIIFSHQRTRSSNAVATRATMLLLPLHTRPHRPCGCNTRSSRGALAFASERRRRPKPSPPTHATRPPFRRPALPAPCICHLHRAHGKATPKNNLHAAISTIDTWTVRPSAV